MTLQEGLKALEYANAIGTALLVWRLRAQHLSKAYRWFFLYLLFDLIESALGWIPLGDRGASMLYMGGQSVKTALALFVVLEVYFLALAERRALAQFSRNLVAYIFIGCFVLSAPALYGLQKNHAFGFRFFLLLEATTDFTLVLFLTGMGLFLAWFPVQIRNNLAAYILGFVVYYSAKWAALMVVIRHTANHQVDLVNTVVYGVTLVCITCWIWAMREDRERQTVTMGPGWSPEVMQRLKARLDEINDSLERLVK